MSCHVKILWGSLCQNLGESKMKFPSNLNCVGNNLSVTHHHHHHARYAPPPTPTPTPPMFFNISLFQVAFLIFFSIAIFSPDFLLVDLFFAVCGSISVRELFKYLELLLTDEELPPPMTSQLNWCHHLCLFFLLYSFSKLILTCRLFVIYVREDNYSEL